MELAVVWIIANRTRNRSDRDSATVSGRVEALLKNEPRLQKVHDSVRKSDRIAGKHGFHMNIVGLCQVEPGTYFEGDFTQWNEEERVLWKTMKYASDAYTIKVRRAAWCHDPIEATFESVGAGPFQMQRSLQSFARMRSCET